MRLLILGAGGKLGQLLRAAWPEGGDVTPIWHGGATSDLQFDILRDRTALRGAITKADGILLLAGVTHARKDRPLSDNAALAQTILAEADNRRIFLASSAAVYGRNPGPLREDTPPAPTSDYGRSKVAMEAVARDQPNTCILRIGNVAGADALLGVPRESYRLDQFAGGGFPVRSYIGPMLLAQALAKLASRPAKDLSAMFNLACPDPVSMADLLDAAGKDWQAQPAGPEAIETVALDTRAVWGAVWGATSPPSDAGSIVADWTETVARL